MRTSWERSVPADGSPGAHQVPAGAPLVTPRVRPGHADSRWGAERTDRGSWGRVTHTSRMTGRPCRPG